MVVTVISVDVFGLETTVLPEIYKYIYIYTDIRIIYVYVLLCILYNYNRL